MALDSDAAGATATLRSLQLARQTLDRDLDVGFNARGLVQIEGRLKADIRIVTMPEGKDPDDVIREDPAAWPKLLKEARPVVDYVIRVVAAGLEPGDAKGKSAAAAQILPLISDIADPVERDHYLSKLAKTLGIDVSALRQAMARRVQEARRRPQERSPAASGKKTGAGGSKPFFPPEPDAPPDDDGALARGMPAGGSGKLSARRLRHTARLEEDFLRQCLENPGALARVNAILTRHNQQEVSAHDFVRADDKAIFAEIQRRATQSSVATIDEMCDSLDSVLAQRVRSLVGLPPRPGMKLDRLPDALVISVLDWRLEKIREHNSILKQIYPAGPSESEDELTRSYLERIQEMGRINQARDAMSATSRRREEDGLQARRSR
jgi:DNA primase